MKIASIAVRMKKCHVWFSSFLYHRSQMLLFLIGSTLLVLGLNEASQAATSTFKPDEINNAVCKLFQLQQGAFGALVMTVAGIGAVVAAAMGAYRAALTMLVVAVGSFILQSLVSLYFGDFKCDKETGLSGLNIPS